MVLRPPANWAASTAAPASLDAATGAPWRAACGWLAFLLPATLGVWLAAATPLWRSDAAAQNLLGAAPQWQGVVSGLLGQLLGLLPVGGTLSRAASLGGLALGLSGALVYRFSLEALDKNGSAPRSGPVLAACAAVASTLCLPWLDEASVAGGQAVAGALALSTLWCARPARPAGDGARAVLVSALLGATALESSWAAISVTLALVVMFWQQGRLPARSEALAFAAGLVVVLGAGLAPALLAPAIAPLQGLTVEEAASLHAGLEVEASLQSLLGPGADVSRWLEETGLLTLVAALVGSAWGLCRRSLRRTIAPWLVLVLFDMSVADARPSELVTEARAVVHLLAIAAVACLAALGLQTLALFTRRAGLAGARPAVVLLAVLTVAVTWAGAEDALRLTARRNLVGVEAWTDEVLAGLPPQSLVLVSSEPVVRRLGVAVASGARGDVTVVPLPLLGQGKLAAELLRLEPALGLLIRDLSTTGRPSEQALTLLADARPLFLEADASWDGRLVAHLIPGPFLSRFAPHALGRSDRLAASTRQEAPFERVLAAASGPATRDAGTLAVLAASARRQVGLLEVLGDKVEAEQLEQRVRRFVEPDAPPLVESPVAPTSLASR